jgi:membrane protease subunit HflC
MTKKLKSTIIVTVLILFALMLWGMCTYSTNEDEYVVVKHFGSIKTIKTEAGLGFNVPIADTIHRIPKSKQFYDLPGSEVITSDKKTMILDAYVLWHVTDPKIFTTSLNANIATAENRIDVIVYNAIKTTVSSITQEELIASRDNSIDVSEDNENKVKIIPITSQILDCIGSQCDQYGIQLDSVEIKVLDLPDENKTAVFDRMSSERNNIAAAYTAQGEAEAQIIKNTTDKEVSIMISEANANAEKIIAEGEAEYMRILSEAYNTPDKQEFYKFIRGLDAVEVSLSDGNATVILGSDSALANALTNP